MPPGHPSRPTMLENELKTLSERIDSLTALSERLLAENRKLRSQESALLAERDELQRKNELAKARVEAIILRLKALEAQE
jgi:cell division protein ZapB